MRSFANALALIAGGSSGIGLALAKNLFESGAHVFILARRQDVMDEALEEIQTGRVSPGQRCGSIQADVSDRARLHEAAAIFLKTHGTPDLVINAAGVAHPGIFTELDPSIFDWMINVNYHGTVNVCREFIPGMLQRRTGHIVNIASAAAYLGVYGYTAYSGSKFAVRGFSDALRSELRPSGIRVSLVYPPDTETPQLAYESQFKPEVTKALTSTANVMSAQDVAISILKGVRRNQYIITPGLENTIFYKLSNIFGAGTHTLVIDRMVDQALKRQRPRKKS